MRTVEIASRVVARMAKRSGDGSAVARTVPLMLKLVHRYGATVIVRGIDTCNEAGWWGSEGADIGQGAVLAPPAEPDEIVALLGSR